MPNKNPDTPLTEDTVIEQTAEGTEVSTEKPVLETIKIVGPCGDDKPCGGGFGSD